MNRFFYDKEQRNGQTVVLQGEDAFHLTRVLHLQSGGQIELCGPDGVCHSAVITELGKGNVQCRLQELLPDHEPGLAIDLAFGLLKGERTDFVLQKATEIGAAAFLPVSTTRTVVKLPRKAEHKTERWQRIVRSAAAQAHRNRVPVVHPPQEFPALLHLFPAYDRVLFFWEGARQGSLASAVEGTGPGARLLLVTGPEGGFSPAETELAQKAGARVVTLGPRILRAETAAITAVALTLYQAGEMGGR
ncbi:MAG TPA: 16S rRNA (uracil(1498)-N(3))-methyltransferase [Firmicutes bacterium]|nr:16S rRNA (uracil(1498)-N(3))-methyltransferase [Bacillota bacterium]